MTGMYFSHYYILIFIFYNFKIIEEIIVYSKRGNARGKYIATYKYIQTV